MTTAKKTTTRAKPARKSKPVRGSARKPVPRKQAAPARAVYFIMRHGYDGSSEQTIGSIAALKKKFPKEIIYRKIGVTSKGELQGQPALIPHDLGPKIKKNPIQKKRYFVVVGEDKGFKTSLDAVAYAQRFANKYKVGLAVVEK